VKYAWIAEHKARWPVKLSCQVLGVSSSGYFEHVRMARSKKAGHQGKNGALSTPLLLTHIRAIHAQVKHEYGSPRMVRALRAQGLAAGKERVRKLMQQHSIKARGKRKFVVTTDSKHKLPVAPNLLDRRFSPAAPNQVWSSDITYIPTDQGWLYLAVVIDLFSRRVVGWSMKDHMQTSLVTDALRMAWFRRRPPAGLIFHSDRGSQYCSQAFQQTLQDYGMQSSMSRKANCWDNAPTESLWARLKVGRLDGKQFATQRQARDEVLDWLNFYNHTRLHSSLGYISPMAFEQRWSADQPQVILSA
jgi:putative transposase